MKEILGTKANLLSLLAHATADKRIFVLCKTDRHISSYLGVMMIEIYTDFIDAEVVTLPSGLSKLNLRKGGEIIFGTDETDMQTHTGHIMVQLTTKK